MKEIKIGETFEHEGRTLIVKEGVVGDCDKCVFWEDDDGCWEYACTSCCRYDGKMVYFEEVKMKEIKIGETFVYEGKVLKAKAGNIYSCLKCVFGNDDKGCHGFSCTPAGRKDGRWICFEEVENG